MLEIIITGRNDNFGGQDFFDRLCAAAAHNHRLLDTLGIDHRFTLAEWNPVEGRPFLAELVRERLPWWHNCLVVDCEWHRALSVNPKLVFMEFFGKNAAIRRSPADAILTTNSDVFLSTPLVKALVGKKLEDRVVYRAVRIDIDRTLDWLHGGEALFADPASHVRVNDVQPPDYGNSAGDFLLMTRTGWMALGGFNERVRYAKIHKDGQFCFNARLEGYAFDVLGPIYHIDHDGSYANAGTLRGSPDQPYGPEWDYRNRYRNAASWGLTAGIDEPAAGGAVTYVHHPSTHGPLLSVVEVEDLSDAAKVNAMLAGAKGQFVVVTTDPTLAVFGGAAALTDPLRTTTAGLILPAGASAMHPALGRMPWFRTPFVMRRDLIDALVEWPAGELEPAFAFWLQAMERAEISETPVAAQAATPTPPFVGSGPQIAALTRRGAEVPARLIEAAIEERLAAARHLPTLVRQWLDALPSDPDSSFAIVGPDWATSMLIEVLASSGRMLAGVFTTLGSEEGTWRWGQRLRPIGELADCRPTHVLAGADARIGDRLRALGCTAVFRVMTPGEDLDTAAADAELDGLRRAQGRDLAAPRLTALLERLPLLTSLEGERAWAHRYDAAQACERAKRPGTALELYQEVTGTCPDQALAMRAAFHTARLLVDRGALQPAAPLLSKILKHNPAHRAARELLDRIVAHEVAV